MRPTFELLLPVDRLFHSRMLFLINQDDRTARGGPKRTAAIIMRFDTFGDVAGMSDVQALVGTADDVDEKGICWRRC